MIINVMHVRQAGGCCTSNITSGHTQLAESNTLSAFLSVNINFHLILMKHDTLFTFTPLKVTSDKNISN